MMNIILVGLMGSGKSTLGAAAAKALHMDFLDMDEFIARRAGLSVSELFVRYGEDAFRQKERAAAATIASMENCLVAAGGGAVLREETMQALKSSGHVIFIDRPPKDIAGDIDTAARPLLRDGPEKLFEIYKARIGLYEKYASSVLENSGGKAAALARLIQMVEELRAPRFAVVGDPIGHSLSPAIHLPVLERYTKAPVYEKAAVKKGGLAGWVEWAKAEKFRGFSLTMPHKTDIIPLLDYIDQEAALAASVNTVIIRDGALWGYTTDAAGFFASLQADNAQYTGRHILILGAGGVVGPLALRAARSGAGSIGILARRRAQAEALAASLKERVPGGAFYAGALEPDSLARYGGEADLLINATPLGMAGVSENWTSLEFLSALPKHCFVYDLIYRPARTRLLAEAKRLGLPHKNGLDMLIYQALAADALFLGVDIEFGKMAAVVKAALDRGKLI